jgi:hypothetical protein
VHVGLPQEVGGLPILCYFVSFSYHAPGALRASPRGWWPSYFVLFILFVLILVYFHNTHQVLVGLPLGVVGLAILFCFILY